MKNFISLFFTQIESLFRKPPLITVLCYHSISDDGTIVDIRPEEFTKQINFIRKNFQCISLDDVLAFVRGKSTVKKPSIAITFDDGYKDLFTKVRPLLKKLKIPAAVFLLSHPNKANRKELENMKDLLNLKEIKSLMRDGWIIGAHTATHPTLTKRGVDLRKEIILSKKKLERDLKRKVRYFAYPKGIYNQKVVESVSAAGFDAAFTVTIEPLRAGTSLYVVPRIGVDWTHSLAQFRAFFTHWIYEYFKVKSIALEA